MEFQADPLRPAAPQSECRITIVKAVKDFLADEQGRKLANTSTSQSKTLLEKQLLSWAQSESLKFLDELTTSKLRDFRTSWGNGALTTQRKHHRLNGFFAFCMENDWILKNASKRMKPVNVSPKPTDYFTPEEFSRIIDGTYAYGNWRGGRDFKHRPLRLRTLILLMRWSGLSILDAVTLERRRLERNRLFLYRHKTGVPVYVPIPPDVVSLLHGLPNSNPRYFFWSGNGDPHTAKKGWQRTLRRLFKTLALKTEDGEPKRCHPHMFRDTFAVELLLAGALMDQVSLLLGHSSIKITEKHYAPFVKARQQQLEASARMAWNNTDQPQVSVGAVM
ncbi:MAG TPA: tyrosine-type recombinase/integrase [Candidatus Angelobacter sp.]|nr:tyrosine-type recombinase/integrase [Candidatus Angelobacter sp.]